MSILNTEDLERQITRGVEIVEQKRIEFEKFFNAGGTPVLLVDPKKEIDLYKAAKDNDALYIDLAFSIPYPMLCRAVKDATSIMFDNIDCIPDSDDKEDIQYLVKYALRKEEDVPTPGHGSISFSDYRIGAACRRIPDYISEGSPACPIFCVVPEE